MITAWFLKVRTQTRTTYVYSPAVAVEGGGGYKIQILQKNLNFEFFVKVLDNLARPYPYCSDSNLVTTLHCLHVVNFAAVAVRVGPQSSTNIVNNEQPSELKIFN